MFQSLSQYSQGQGLDFGDGLWLAGAVTEHTGEIGDLGHPAAIVLAFELDLEGHQGTLALGWLPNKPLLQPTSGELH